MSFSVHLDKYLVCVTADTFSARILSNTFVNVFPCLFPYDIHVWKTLKVDMMIVLT